MITLPSSPYLTRMTLRGMVPNFWCSRAYWAMAGWRELSHYGVCRVVDEDGEDMLEPLRESGAPHPGPYWAGPACASPSDYEWTGATTLDRQYIYNPLPLNTAALAGSRWRPVRKELNAVERQIGGIRHGRALCPGEREEEVAALLAEWLHGAGLEEVNDPELMVRYALHSRWRLPVLAGERLVGLNIVEPEPEVGMVFYRYCIVTPEVPYLSTAARMLVRTEAQMPIHDGGDLDREGLRRYKMKMNPDHIQFVPTKE